MFLLTLCRVYNPRISFDYLRLGFRYSAVSKFHFLAASVWQLCKPPVHASVCQSDASGKISSEKLHPQGLFGLRSNILSIGKVNTSFDSRSLLSRRSRKSMTTRGVFLN